MGRSTLGELLERIDREDPTGLLFDGIGRYQPGVLRRTLEPDKLRQVVQWDSVGRIYRAVGENNSADLLYHFEEPRPWEPPTSTQRWVEAAADLGWGRILAGLWFVAWVGGVIKATDSTWRAISLVVTISTVGVVIALLTYMFHKKRMADAKAQERAASASRWLKEHPRKGERWREV